MYLIPIFEPFLLFRRDVIDNKSKRKVGFVVNPKAGINKSAYDEIKSLCRKIFDDSYQIEIHLTRSPGDATAISKHYAQDHFDVVASAGGDGTANETAQGLLGSETAMTIIPYGSGNGLARGLRIPMNKEKAIRTILTGRPRLIDVGEITDGEKRKLFFGFSGIGYDAFIGKLFNDRTGRRGLFSYIYLSIVSYSKFKPVPLRIKVNDKEIFTNPFVLAVANTGEYGNGAKIAPHAIPDDGFFELCILQDMTMFKGLLHGWRLFDGSIDKMAEMTMLRTTKVEVFPESSVYYHADGETEQTSSPLVFSILPLQLKMIAPM
ncbi:diacylglycerol kinase family lipid kinase [bacterium]|nr:diacylglycerol kinase family lipid kinase [bacterium]